MREARRHRVILRRGGLFLGRGAVLPLVNMASICLAFTFVLGCIALIRLRRQDRAAAATGPGGRVMIPLALLGSLAMSLIALLEPLTRGGTFPLEWMLMLGWAALGFAFYARSNLAP